jgi:glutamate carboxypeptidase
MESARAHRLLERLRARRGEMRALLERLARAESPSRHPAELEAALELYAGELEARGLRARRYAGRRSGGVLVACPRERARPRPYQLLLGHLDTVWPVGTLAEMPVADEDGRVRGPGVYDMKAGLVQALFALDALREEAPGPPAVTPVLLVNTDEEVGSRESTPFVRRLARRADRVFVLEPSLGPDGRLKTARKGVGRFTVRVRGVAAHAGLDPERGASAILELAHVVQALFAMNDPARGLTVNVGTIDGGLGANVVAPESHAVVDVRVANHEDAQEIEERIHALRATTPGTTLEIAGRIGRPPMERTPGNARLWEAARAAGAQLGLRLEQATAGGGSDGNTTSLYAPTLDGLGAVGEGAHARNEKVRLDAMADRAALLAILLARPALGAADRGVEAER